MLREATFSMYVRPARASEGTSSHVPILFARKMSGTIAPAAPPDVRMAPRVLGENRQHHDRE